MRKTLGIAVFNSVFLQTRHQTSDMKAVLRYSNGVFFTETGKGSRLKLRNQIVNFKHAKVLNEFVDATLVSAYSI